MKRSARPLVSSSALSLFLLTTHCSLLTTGLVWAEAVGSPAGILKKGRWVMGGGGGGLAGRALSGSANATIYQLGHFRGYGLTDRLSVYGKIGGAYLEIDDAAVQTATSPSSVHSFGAGFMVGVGVKGRLWRSASQKWEWDGSIQYVDVRTPHRSKNDGHWREWVGATSVARSFGRIKPYLGLKYSVLDVDAKYRENGRTFQQVVYEAETTVGPFFGTDVYFGNQEDVIINVETSYLNGPELDLAVQYLF